MGLDLGLEMAKWKEFVCLFRERFVRDSTPWAGISSHKNQGSQKFPYQLYFSGNLGQRQDESKSEELES